MSVTIVTLHDAVCDFLEKTVAPRFKLKTANADGDVSIVAPQIIRTGFPMPKSLDSDVSDDEIFPFIMPRIRHVKNIKNERQSTATIDLHFGVYDPGQYDADGILIDDGSGYRDLWNLIESTRQSLFETMTIDNKFRIVEDVFDADMYPEQIYPYWEGWLRTEWHILYPRTAWEENLFQ